MVLTSLINFARSKQTNGRYVLAPFAWVFALMFSLGRQDGIPPVPPIVAAVVAPEIVAEDTAIAPLDDPEIVSPPARVIEPPAPRPIRRDSFFSDLRGPLNLNDWRISQLENTHAGVFYGGPWVPENIIQKHDRLILKVRAGEDGKRPTMAEMQSRRRFGYGRYEVIMRPSGESGSFRPSSLILDPLEATRMMRSISSSLARGLKGSSTIISGAAEKVPTAANSWISTIQSA